VAADVPGEGAVKMGLAEQQDVIQALATERAEEADRTSSRGYASSSTFLCAFRRWTGMQPTAYRKAHGTAR
jgi:methylphosphotriester-DNA--protein-cysteine methyltransferase